MSLVSYFKWFESSLVLKLFHKVYKTTIRMYAFRNLYQTVKLIFWTSKYFPFCWRKFFLINYVFYFRFPSPAVNDNINISFIIQRIKEELNTTYTTEYYTWITFSFTHIAYGAKKRGGSFQIDQLVGVQENRRYMLH